MEEVNVAATATSILCSQDEYYQISTKEEPFLDVDGITITIKTSLEFWNSRKIMMEDDPYTDI